VYVFSFNTFRCNSADVAAVLKFHKSCHIFSPYFLLQILNNPILKLCIRIANRVWSHFFGYTVPGTSCPVSSMQFLLNRKQGAPWRARHLFAETYGKFSVGKLVGKNCMEAIFPRFPGSLETSLRNPAFASIA
ncbi:MAG: hypothetical protein J6X67_05190, partial [Treponema sp.]|nr:hypothetical protein [Treponema sp.]